MTKNQAKSIRWFLDSWWSKSWPPIIKSLFPALWVKKSNDRRQYHKLFCEKSSFVNKIEWSVVNFRLSKSKISSLNIYVSSGHMSLFSFQFFLFTNRIFAIEPDSWGLLCSYLLNLQGSVLAMSSDYIFWDIVFTWHRRLAESANDQLLSYSDRQKQG